MIGGVTRHILPRLPGVPHLHVTGPNTLRYLCRSYVPADKHMKWENILP